MVLEIVEPNQFVLQGVGHDHKDTHINYSTTSITGKLILTYKDPKDTHNFTGDGIRTQKTDIDMMVTVTIESIPDFHRTTLTLFVPTINLDGSNKKFKTFAIETTSKDIIAGAHLVKGAVQSYKVIGFSGTASHVMF
jgi:hypothetical protein